VDAGWLCDLSTQPGLSRASTLAWRIRTDDNGLLGARESVDLIFKLGKCSRWARAPSPGLRAGHPGFTYAPRCNMKKAIKSKRLPRWQSPDLMGKTNNVAAPGCVTVTASAATGPCPARRGVGSMAGSARAP
jgi:hypothetical protein